MHLVTYRGYLNSTDQAGTGDDMFQEVATYISYS